MPLSPSHAIEEKRVILIQNKLEVLGYLQNVFPDIIRDDGRCGKWLKMLFLTIWR